jgi:choline dehydrogenase-like flavoprotein
MRDADRFDVVIIGRGVSAGTLAWRLAASGERIVLLERGGYVPREQDCWSSRAVNREGKYRKVGPPLSPLGGPYWLLAEP